MNPRRSTGPLDHVCLDAVSSLVEAALAVGMPLGLVVFSSSPHSTHRNALRRNHCSSRAAPSLGVGHAFVAAPVVQPSVAHAFFESRAQQLLQPLAAAQPRVAGLLREVAEIDRRRSKMPADYEDDAYVLRFTRSVLDPLVPSMAEVATSLPAVSGTIRRAARPGSPPTSRRVWRRSTPRAATSVRPRARGAARRLGGARRVPCNARPCEIRRKSA